MEHTTLHTSSEAATYKTWARTGTRRTQRIKLALYAWAMTLLSLNFTPLLSSSCRRTLMADHNSQDPLDRFIRITKILPRILFSSIRFAVLLTLYAANHDNDFSFINLLDRFSAITGVCCCIDVSRYALVTGVPILYHSLVMVLKRRWTFGRWVALALRITDSHWQPCKYNYTGFWCCTFLTSVIATFSQPRETTPLLPLHADDIV
jgi:hypothetical protein